MLTSRCNAASLSASRWLSAMRQLSTAFFFPDPRVLCRALDRILQNRGTRAKPWSRVVSLPRTQVSPLICLPRRRPGLPGPHRQAPALAESWIPTTRAGMTMQNGGRFHLTRKDFRTSQCLGDASACASCHSQIATRSNLSSSAALTGGRHLRAKWQPERMIASKSESCKVLGCSPM